MEEKAAYAFPAVSECSTVQVISEANASHICAFCKKPDVDDLKIGPLYFLPESDIKSHYFCLLFAAGIAQHGDDSQGIWGFLPQDILGEVRRAQRLKCAYCKTYGASIGCFNSRCKASFHFPCGLSNDVNYQFVAGNFISYCKDHSQRPFKDLPIPQQECPICFNMVESPEKPVISLCCKSAIFHKDCIQKHALSSGYFYKCPMCNSKKNFVTDTKLQGIFVPAQDASWERVDDAFGDLYVQYGHCDTENCECPRGRDYGANKGNWLLARCRVCGSAGTHRQCGKLTTIANWICSSCSAVESRQEKKRKAFNKLKAAQESLKPRGSATTNNLQMVLEDPSLRERKNSNELLTVQRKSIPGEKKNNNELPKVQKEPKLELSTIANASSNSKAVSTIADMKQIDVQSKSKNRKKPFRLTSGKGKSYRAAVKSGLKSKATLTRVETKTDMLPPPPPKRAKTTLPTNEEEEEEDVKVEVEVEAEAEEAVDLGKLHIISSCSDFFPYNREAKKRWAAKGQCFPDWRGYFLQVELVNVLLDATELPAHRPASENAEANKIPTDAVTVEPKDQSNDISQPVTLTNESNCKPRLAKRGRKKRGNSWKRGVVKQKRKATITKPKSTITSENSLSQPNTSNEVEKEIQPSASQAILEGIRRSHESLLQFQQDQAADKRGDAQSEPESESLNLTSSGTPVEGGKSKKRPRDTAFPSATKNEDTTGIKREKTDSVGSPPSNVETSSQNEPQDIRYRIIIKPEFEGNAESPALNGSDTPVSSQCNEDSHRNGANSNIDTSDRVIIKIERPPEETIIQTQSDGMHDMDTVGRSNESTTNIAQQLQQSAHGIARELLKLSDRSKANENLRILEQSCPQLFQKNSKA